MDKGVVHRFSDWFAYYLSHIDFQWKWDNWTRDVERAKTELTDQIVFLHETIGKSARLAYVDKIAQVLPADWHDTMVPDPMEPSSDLADIQDGLCCLKIYCSDLFFFFF